MKISSSYRKILSHEFKTALTGILSNAELLRDIKLRPNQIKSCIEDIYSSGKELLYFVDNLLKDSNENKIEKDISFKSKCYQAKEKLTISNQIYWLSVLLVEDDPIVQRVHSKMLLSLGCNVEIVNDGYKALRMLTGAHNYEVIFMDIGLPKMSGIKTVEKIREQEINKALPIIGLTAYQLDEIKEECKTAGFDKLLSKPIALSALKAILLKIAKQKINHQIT